MSRLIWSIVIGLFCLVASEHAVAAKKSLISGDDPEELARTWSGSRVYIPGITRQIHTRMKSLPVDFRAGKQGQFPLIIYLHGCSGFWRGTAQRANFFTQLGFAVIAPDSFARREKPVSCVPRRKIGGFHRGVLYLR